MSGPTLVVVAKAPVPGLAKTRIAAEVGDETAAAVAAAALLDTLRTTHAVAVTGDLPVVVAMTGDLDAAARADDLNAALSGLRVVPQRGDTFGERLAAAHADADRGHGTVQIGMDTPQVTMADLREAVDLVGAGDRAFGPAEDGGWWLLGLPDPAEAEALTTVQMSTTDTGALTVAAVGEVVRLRSMLDMDHWDDAVRIAATIPQSELARTVTRAGAAAR